MSELFLLSLLLTNLMPIVTIVVLYFCLFHSFTWVAFGISIFSWFLGVCLVFIVSPKSKAAVVYFAATSAGFGWAWLLSIPTSIWFLISFFFFTASGWEVGYSLLVGALSKGWARDFNFAKVNEMSGLWPNPEVENAGSPKDKTDETD